VKYVEGKFPQFQDKYLSDRRHAIEKKDALATFQGGRGTSDKGSTKIQLLKIDHPQHGEVYCPRAEEENQPKRSDSRSLATREKEEEKRTNTTVDQELSRKKQARDLGAEEGRRCRTATGAPSLRTFSSSSNNRNLL